MITLAALIMKTLLTFSLFFSSLSLNAQTDIHSDTNYYENARIRDILTYRKNKLINHIGFDEKGNLNYQSPLLPSQKTTSFKLKSGRSFFDTSKLDTIIFDTNVPAINLYVYFPDATVQKINSYTYFIKAWKPQPNTNKGKIVVDISENSFFKPKNVYHKIQLIEIK